MGLKKRSFISLVVGVMLALSLATPAMAVPQIPHAFYGSVTIGGEPAPNGTVISARIGDTEYATTTTLDGKYGYSPAFKVPADDPDTPDIEGGVKGDTIEFYLEGSKVASCMFANGQVTNLPLEAEVLPDFNIVLSPSSVSVQRPGSALVTIGITGVGDFSEVVSLSATGQPTGVTVEFSPESGTVPFNSDMNLNVASTAPTGSHTITIVGSSSVKDHESTLTLTVTTPPPAPGGGGPAADTTPPVISNVGSCFAGVTETTADICWTTNELSTSQVEYWTSPSMLSPLDETRVIDHHVHLTGLTPGTTYHYKTMSRDAAGNLAVSDEDTFTTLEAPAAAFASSALRISPTEVNIGEEVTIRVSVTNIGNAAGSYEVILKIEDVVVATEEVTLNAGASEEITFTTAKDVAGSYSVTVDGLSGSFTVVVPVVAPLPAAFSVSNLSIQPAEVLTGEAVTIDVALTNTGGTHGSYTLVLKINGVEEADRTVTIAAGDTLNLIFPVTKEDAGSYTVTVDGLSGSFTVVAAAVVTNWPLIGGIIGAVIVIGLLVFFLVFRRRAYYKT